MIRTAAVFAIVLATSAAPAAPKSFEQALDEIVVRSTSVEIQRSRLSASETLLLSKRLAFLPSLSLNASQKDVGDPRLTTKSLEATASLNLFRFGGDLAILKSSEAGRDYERAGLDQSVLSAEAEGVSALIALFQARMSVAINRMRVESADELLGIASARFKKGLLPAEEVSRIEIDLANERAQLDNQLAELQISEANVARLLGHAEVAGDWPWINAMKSPKIRAFLERKPALEERPDYRAAQLLMESEDQRARGYYRSMLPSLDLTYSRGQYDTGAGFNPGWAAMLTLSIPLFNRFDDYSAYKSQAEKSRQAELRLEQLKRDELNLQKAHQENFRLALRTAEARVKTLEAAQRLLRVNVARFKAGRADANDLAVERDRVSRAEILAIEGWARAHSALVKLLHSFGSGVRGL